MKTRNRETSPNKPVGIWIRVSTEMQALGDSPEHHEQRARLYAQAQGWNVVKVYHLEAVSGKSVMDSPETKAMLEDVKKGRIKGLIFSKLARLARNTRELLDFADYFQHHNADLVSLQECIDTSTPIARVFYTIIAAMAQWEREEISERVAASVPIRAKLGKPLGGAAPFGYQWVEGKLIPDPQTAPVRKLIYDLFLEHRRLKTVARKLNETGYRTRRGAKFGDTTVRRLIEDPTAKGLRRANYTKSTGDKKHWVPKPESEWIYVAVEPIVSEEIWDRCNAILAERVNSRKRPAKKPAQLFTGLTFCSCGKHQKMYVPSNSPKYICYKCRNKIPIEDLEAVYYEQLKHFLTPSDLTEHLSQADSTIQAKEELLNKLQREEKKIRSEMDKLIRLSAEGKIPNQRFGEHYQPLEERLTQLENEIPRLQSEVDFFKISLLSSDQILSDANDLYRRWPKLNFDEKRNIVETITEEIIVDTNQVTINLCYIPSYENMAGKHRNFTGSPQKSS